VKLNFLFWNLNKKLLVEQIYNLSVCHKIDIFLFAECVIQPEIILLELNKIKTKYHYSQRVGCDKIEIFTKFHSRYILPIKETSRMTIRRLTLPKLEEIIIVALHFPSKSYWSDEGLAIECTKISSIIREVEEDEGHSRTIVVGDLNMDPFEKGIVAASGFHGTMSRDIAAKGYRTLDGVKHQFFYNPMWNFLGDNNETPGSYYYNNSEQINYYWGLFDQVLVRPQLLQNFNTNDIKVLASDGNQSLLNSNNIPNKNIYSDHLPILFSLEF
jgi:exonuclease III